MFLTRPHFFAGQQAQAAHCSMLQFTNTITAQNWRTAGRTVLVGTQTGRSCTPGYCPLVVSTCSKSGK